MTLKQFLTDLALAVTGGLLAATVAAAACSISTTSVNFGNYNVFATTPLDSTGQVTFRCTGSPVVSVQITIDKGGAPSFNPRLLRQGSQTLSYNLYLDGARAVLWGDGTGGTQTYTQLLPPLSQDITVQVFGRIPAGQDVSAGVYTNTVTVTIFF